MMKAVKNTCDKDLFLTINDAALNEIEVFGGPSLAHYNLSIKKGEQLAKKLGADVELAKCGIALMDIKLGESIKLGRQSEHVKMSYDFSLKLLNELKVDAKTTKILLNCVEAHHGKAKFQSLETEICANADCYRFIHPQGVFTFIQTVTKRGMNQNDAIDAVLAKLEEKHNILSLEICKQELEPVYVKMKEFLLNSKI